MRRFSGWLVGSSASSGNILSKEDELPALNEVIAQAAWAMNDEVKRAQEAVQKGSTPFHKLGYGAVLFWQSALGFDKTMMAQASQALAEGEEAAAEHLRAAQRDPTIAHQSKIYPAGAEYALVQALCQLLGAILGILKESWLEGLTGLNKLRKAYITLQGLVAAEAKYLEANPPPRQSEDGEFADAEETIANGSAASLRKGSIAGSVRSRGSTRRSAKSPNTPIDFRTVSQDPLDLFIHTGVVMPWGIINIVLSLVPPALRHILSMFNFRGDKNTGLDLLWDASSDTENILGVIAALVILLYNNIAVGLADILTSDAYPQARLEELLSRLKTRYPDSQLWVTESARIAVNNRDLEKGLRLLNEPAGPSFPEMQGLRLFEKSLDLLFLHRYEECAASWMETLKLNRWSHGMYYYIAAACYIELFRDAQRAGDLVKAGAYKEKVTEFLKPVTPLVRVKALLGRQLPFDAFIDTKVMKWEARSKATGKHVVDCVGVSPVEEMCYFWTGYRRASPEILQTSLARLALCETSPGWKDETPDEKAALAVLQGTALRNLGRFDEAKGKLQTGVIAAYTSGQIKAVQHATTYALPVAHYELAVALWEENGGEKAGPGVLREVKEEIEKCDKWEHWDLEDRMVVKLGAAKESLGKLGV